MLLELLHNRFERILGVRLAIRTAKMTHQNDGLGPMIEGVLYTMALVQISKPSRRP